MPVVTSQPLAASGGGGSLLDPLYDAVAWAMIHIRDGLAALPGFGPDSGLTWGLSIVVLVALMRLALFPVFARQFKSQRRMMDLQPQVKALQDKYRDDRQKLAEAQMKLFRENNVNPFSSCLPLLIQAPIFLALFRVLTSFQPDAGGAFHAQHGISAAAVQSAARAQVFGAPLAAGFRSADDVIHRLGGSPLNVRLVAVALIVTMTIAQFLASKQMMSRQAAQAGTAAAQQQKVMLYVLPVVFGAFAFIYPTPLGVLLYWLTTNLWSFGQQQVLLRHMAPAAAAAGATAGNGRPSAPPRSKRDAAAAGAEGSRTQRNSAAARRGGGRRAASSGPDVVAPGASPASANGTSTTSTTNGAGPAARRQPTRQSRSDRRGKPAR